ncbi:MAG TPA: serine/threonine-protein kinase [Pyrinomonadaceae bacterium]|nr:serine/threonine-protein kinase [Pyrinomonadaceae bacterium]
MESCPRCFAEFADSAAECPACGLSVEYGSDETAFLPVDPQSDTPTRLETPSHRNNTPTRTTGGSGRFVSGMVLAGRYRIVGLIGKGGMGEVYKAEDLELEQTVALKFLPEELSRNEELLRRFRGEVRNARQVSHRNVCRVFDIGETKGLYYITMEYIDGDDLSMLLKRIGRLPSDKAVEISRDICMGLAAIHKAGILHRDLKPANIIIDSKGEARITDFGIAGIEAEVQGNESRVGTPAYMSPEQIDGKEVTQRSDIYSLGLLLYEIFTGKQAFEGESVQELQIKKATTSPKNPSEIVTGIDPLVENVIKRCLQKDPTQRPESALNVAMSLPGGDPLQIALDAGQTPSPEMVAASPKKGALKPMVAFAMLAVVVAGIGFLMLTSKKAFVHRIVPLEKSSEILRERGRELVQKFGYKEGDSYSTFECACRPGENYHDYLKENDQSPERWQKLAAGQPAMFGLVYRSSPGPIVPVRDRKVTSWDPQNTVPGMALVVLDTKGRMIHFAGVPERVDEPVTAAGAFDWAAVLKEAGFDIAAFQSIDPQWTPPVAFDDRRAFSGVYPEAPDVAIRVEAAAYRGKLVSFEIIEPWTKPPAAAAAQDDTPVFTFVLVGIYFGVLFFSAWLSVRHVRNGRSDLKGAFRVAVFVFGARMVMWLFATHHVAALIGEVNLFISGLQAALYWAAMAGFMYLAFEPYLRKRAPERIISWSRLIAGDWRDPLVGRDVLIGTSAGIGFCALAVFAVQLLPMWRSQPAPNLLLISGQGPGGSPFGGLGGFPDMFADKISESLIAAFIFSFLILFLGLFLRRKLLGAAAVWLIFSWLMITAGIMENGSVAQIVVSCVLATLIISVTFRFGVVALTLCLMAISIANLPVTTELSAWYASDFVLFAVVLIGMAGFGFYTSTAGQKLWQVKLLSDGD